MTATRLLITAVLSLSTTSLYANTSNTAEDSLETRITSLEAALQNQARWQESLTITGLAEIEASFIDTQNASSTSDLVIATAAVDINATVSDTLSAKIALLYEEDDTPLEVDIATVAFTDTNNQLTATLGQDYLPFGAFETNLVNDPLTLSLGETRETTLSLSSTAGKLSGTIYLFNGEQDENNEDRLNNFGARLQISGEQYVLGADYISNLADSDTLQALNLIGTTGGNAVSGMSVYGKLLLGNLNFYLERLSASDDLLPTSTATEPSASHFEIAFLKNQVTYALAYQTTNDASFIALPKKRLSAGLNTQLANQLNLAFEVSRDEDYDLTAGGTDATTNSWVIQLAAEF